MDDEVVHRDTTPRDDEVAPNNDEGGP